MSAAVSPIVIRVSSDLRDSLDQAARAIGLDRSTLCREVFRLYLDERSADTLKRVDAERKAAKRQIDLFAKAPK